MNCMFSKNSAFKYLGRVFKSRNLSTIHFFDLFLIALLSFFPFANQGDSQLLVGSDQGKAITILYTNDIHGNIDFKTAFWMNPTFPPELGGGASLATYIKKIKSQAEEDGAGFLLLDAGDIFQGTPVGDETKGKAAIEFMNMVGYDAWTPGNHDFDFGVENLQKLMREAKVPILGANVTVEGSEKLLEPLVPYIIKEINGIKVAIIGLVTGDTKTLCTPECTKGIEFTKSALTLRKYVQEAREKGAEIVLSLSHIGIPSDTRERYLKLEESSPDMEDIVKQWELNLLELSATVKGVDAFFGGHIHWGVREPYEDPVNHTLCFQTYGKLSGVGHITLYVNERTKKICGYKIPQYSGLESTLFSDEFEPDSTVLAYISKETAIAEVGFDEVLGEALQDIQRGDAENMMGQFIADAVKEGTGVDVVFLNRGGIRDQINSGPITRRDVFQALPFGNTVVVFTVDGKTLKDIMEIGVMGRRRDLQIAGAYIKDDRHRPDGDRIIEFLVNGEPLVLDKTYKAATSDYLGMGSAGYEMLLKLTAVKVNTDVKISDYVAWHIKKHTPIEREFYPRIITPYMPPR